MKRPIWSRSVTVDENGIGRTSYGRADFIYTVWMAGYSIEELKTDWLDGFGVPGRVIEDCIRFCQDRKRRRTTQAKSTEDA